MSAGLADVRTHVMTRWREAERTMWLRAAAAEPGDDPALRSLHDEGVRTLPWLERTDRVLVTACRP